MHTESFLQDLAVVMIVAGLVTILCHRFRQPVVLGYILAGVIVGPHTPPFPLIQNEETIQTLSELGVVLLLFSLGLEFNLGKLRRVGGAALIAASVEILLMAWGGYEIGRSFGWSLMDSLFLGAMLSISSTTIIIRTLAELGKSKERFAQLIFGILVIEDILGIALLALLSSIAMTGSLQVGDVGKTLGKLAIFLVASLVAGLLLVPRLLAYVTRFRSQEMLLITVLGLCFGYSLLAVKLGYSAALGAFLIGAVIAESREIHRVEQLIEPVRDMFSAIFFVAIGLLINPQILIQHWLAVVVITAAVVVGKVVSCSFGAFVGGHDTRTALRVGMGLAQIGEFSFIIASLGLALKVTSDFLYPVAVAVSVLTTLLTPYLIQSSDAVVTQFGRRAPRAVVQMLDLYTNWIGQLGQPHPSFTHSLLRRWFAQMALNAILMAAVFLTVAFFTEHPPDWLQRYQLPDLWLKSTAWLLAMILSLPMFIATLRKLEAVGLLVAESRVSERAAGPRTQAIRAILAQSILLAGTVILALYLLILSTPLLTTVRMFLALLVVAGVISWLCRRFFVRVYAQAQTTLEQSFTTEPSSASESAPGSDNNAPPLLREANVLTLTLPGNSPAAGKRIRELQLRTQTGATIIGIERSSGNLLNPGPDEELHRGDHVLLLGSPSQLEIARTFLARVAPASSGLPDA